MGAKNKTKKQVEEEEEEKKRLKKKKKKKKKANPIAPSFDDILPFEQKHY